MNRIGGVINTAALLNAPYLNNLILLISDLSRLSHRYINGNKIQIIIAKIQDSQFLLKKNPM
jgi:hypothetical protein